MIISEYCYVCQEEKKVKLSDTLLLLDENLYIDQEVIIASKKHLRGICHDSLDKLEGPNYKVIM